MGGNIRKHLKEYLTGPALIAFAFAFSQFCDFVVPPNPNFDDVMRSGQDASAIVTDLNEAKVKINNVPQRRMSYEFGTPKQS